MLGGHSTLNTVVHLHFLLGPCTTHCIEAFTAWQKPSHAVGLRSASSQLRQLSKTSGPTCEFWTDPVHFRFERLAAAAAAAAGRGRSRRPSRSSGSPRSGRWRLSGCAACSSMLTSWVLHIFSMRNANGRRGRGGDQNGGLARGLERPDGLFAVGGLVVCGVRFFYFYT
jgi:hypothetical protein